MKRLILIVLLVVGWLSVGSVWAGEYTYDGKIDPATITNEWEFQKIVNIGNGYVEVEFLNTAPEAELRIGLILVFTPTGRVHGFAYLDAGEPKVFLLDESNHYCQQGFEDDFAKNRFRERLLRIINGKYM